ncbi:MAG: DUF6625 family protein [Pseudomonas sp.]
MVEKSIVFIIPYFGRWPFWLPLFLKSCQLNPTVNWILYSDCGEPDLLPTNVRYVEITFSEYCENVSRRLQCDFSPQRAYKLCDVKPALGFIHEPDIQEFDFWGFSDLDLIYGDLRGYFNAERLTNFDFFSTHERRVSGHLCLMRNNEKMRLAFRKIPNFLQRLCDQKSHALDEGGFSRIFLWRKNWPAPFFKLAGFFNPWRRRALFEELYSTPNAGRPWIDGSRVFPKQWFWHAGVLNTDITGKRSFPYFHFYGWKKWHWNKEQYPSWAEMVELASRDCWRIDAEGFHALECVNLPTK